MANESGAVKRVMFDGGYTTFSDAVNKTDPTGMQFLGMPSPRLGTNPICMLSNKPVVESTPNLHQSTVEAIPRTIPKIEWHHIVLRQLKSEQIVKDAIKEGLKFEGLPSDNTQIQNNLFINPSININDEIFRNLRLY